MAQTLILGGIGTLVVVGITTLFISALALRNARRAAGIGESWLELIREQHDRLELLREERQMLVEELGRRRQRDAWVMARLSSTRKRNRATKRISGTRTQRRQNTPIVPVARHLDDPVIR